MKDLELRERVIAYNRQVAADREVVAIVQAAGITIDTKPDTPPARTGLNWIPYQAKAGGSISWTESEYDPTLPGTAETPIPFEDGLTVYPNYYYTRDGMRKVWIGAESAAPEWDDDNFVEF